jgi:hypothetical protein
MGGFVGRSGWLTSRVWIWSSLVQGAFPRTFCFLKVRSGKLHLCRALKFPRNKTIAKEWKTNLMSLAVLFHLLCAQHVSDINISIVRSLRLCCWITTSVFLLSVRRVLEIWCGWVWVVPVLQADSVGDLVRLGLSSATVAGCSTTSTTQNQPHQSTNTQRTENKTTNVVIQQHSRKLLMVDILTL